LNFPGGLIGSGDATTDNTELTLSKLTGLPTNRQTEMLRYIEALDRSGAVTPLAKFA
jgi:hypothetical protein